MYILRQSLIIVLEFPGLIYSAFISHLSPPHTPPPPLLQRLLLHLLAPLSPLHQPLVLPRHHLRPRIPRQNTTQHHLDDSSPLLVISDDTSSFPYTFCGRLRSMIRVVCAMDRNETDVRWFVLDDDDIVFFIDKRVVVAGAKLNLRRGNGSSHNVVNGYSSDGDLCRINNSGCFSSTTKEFWVGNKELVNMYEEKLGDVGYHLFKLPRTNNRGDESCASVALVVQERRHLGDGKNIQVAELR
ncbi:hypothetical protein JHK86_043329 [Glycine max]|nr:hypothetical protein JHK86_043329 [Glycine max]